MTKNSDMVTRTENGYVSKNYNTTDNADPQLQRQIFPP